MLDMDLAAVHHMMLSFLLEKVGIKSPGSVMQMGSACFSLKLAIVISVFFYEKVFFFPQKNWEISGIFLLLQILLILLIFGNIFSKFSISENRKKKIRKEKKKPSCDSF